MRIDGKRASAFSDSEIKDMLMTGYSPQGQEFK